jgi:tetratricopeptide (TPR) repeat protein
MHLNFGRIPLWLDEGLAEYLGNARLGNKEARIGLIDDSHLYILQQNKLLPIETLFSVDNNSPHYNEANRASVFYAESWVLVHYLMLDQNARQQKLLNKFLDAYGKSGDQIGAARETFGDLKKFGQLIESYARQSNFYNGVLKPPTDAMDKNYTARALSAGEVLALKGDFFVHGNHLNAAKPVLDEAVKQEPKLALAHEALGMYDYRMQDLAAADREMKEAIELGTSNFLPYYMHGFLELQGGFSDEDKAHEAAENLSKALKMNPDFAPAYDALANALGRPGQDQTKAINAAIQATKLEPANLAYSIHLTFLLLNANREAEAKTMAKRIENAASTPQEKIMAEQMIQTIEERARWQESAKTQGADGSYVTPENGATVTTTVMIAPKGTKDGDSSAANSGTLLVEKRLLPVDGEITAAACPKEGEMMITLKLSGSIMKVHIEDLDEVEIVEGQGKPAPEPDNCSAWKGRQVRVWFTPAPGKEYAGEIKKVYFF